MAGPENSTREPDPLKAPRPGVEPERDPDHIAKIHARMDERDPMGPGVNPEPISDS